MANHILVRAAKRHRIVRIQVSVDDFIHLYEINSSPGSCKSIQIYQKTRKDGEYKINIRGREVEIYCHNMNTENPKEYLTLKRGNHENYALFYSKRSTDSSKCDNAKGVVDDSIQYGTTRVTSFKA